MRAAERLKHFKAGTGVYSGTVLSRAEGEARVQRLRWRSAVEDAELLEPYVGAARAWQLASAFWRVL